MEDVIKIATYISQRYHYDIGARIEEVKLYILLYFIQRECLVETDLPMFDDEFIVSIDGPVMLSVHQALKEGALSCCLSSVVVSKYQKIFDHVFKTYARKDIIGLMTLIRSEYSWKKAWQEKCRQNLEKIEIKTADIAKDAERIRTRRFLLKHYTGFQNPVYA